MSLTYCDAASILFGERPFSVTEFADRIGTPRAAKVLSEMKARGLVARTGRGHYRLLRPSERPDLRRMDWRNTREAILAAPMWKAWAGPTAVEIWTRRRYKTSPSAFIREFHIAIRANDMEAWRRHLAANNVPIGRKHIGVHVRLVPVRDDANATIRGGEPVIPREEVLRLIRSNPALYGDAEVLID